MSRASTLFVCLALVGCGTLRPGSITAPPTAGSAAEVTASPAGSAFFIRTGAGGHTLPLDAETSWPADWMVDAHGATLPVVDSIGRALCDARTAFHEGLTSRAARQLDAAADALTAPDDVSARRVDTVASLRALARRITTGELTTMHLFEGVITRAYAARLSQGWVPLTPLELGDVLAREGELMRTLAAPQGDSARVRSLLLALSRVELAQDASTDAELEVALGRLDAFVRADAPAADPAARDAVLCRLDLAFARHDLERAELELRDSSHAASLGAALIALARHVANLDERRGDGSSELATRLDAEGRRALEGHPSRSTAATLAQAARHLRDVASSSPAS